MAPCLPLQEMPSWLFPRAPQCLAQSSVEKVNVHPTYPSFKADSFSQLFLQVTWGDKAPHSFLQTTLFLLQGGHMDNARQLTRKPLPVVNSHLRRTQKHHSVIVFSME